ncbi:hypothetical protein CORI_0366 [Campylobacter sp. CCUG 57310]|nr:hypothetical protein CORI_0366 [Campylobacter sp. CCUG 57310]
MIFYRQSNVAHIQCLVYLVLHRWGYKPSIGFKCAQEQKKMCPIIVEGSYKIEIADVIFKRHRNSYVAIGSSERLHNKTQILLTKWFVRL